MRKSGESFGSTITRSLLHALAILNLAASSLEVSSVKAALPEPAPLRMLALGDSYTIGEGIQPSNRWPVQLCAALREQGFSISEPQIVAQTGWTTAELIAAIETAAPVGPYDLVTLLIGVNNQYRGGAIREYRSEFQSLLSAAIRFAGGEPSRVIVLSIPDWGVTPFALGRDRARIAAEINRFNAANRTLAASQRVLYVDVTPISRRAAGDSGLLASDELHPSGMMYAEWVKLVLPDALAALRSGLH